MKTSPFSKRLLYLDYIITIALLSLFIVEIVVNVIYQVKTVADLINLGNFEAIAYISAPIDLSQLAIITTAWIAQLGISSAAYYFMAKSDHSIELPAKMIKELPKSLRESVDVTQVMVAAIQTKN